MTTESELIGIFYIDNQQLKVCKFKNLHDFLITCDRYEFDQRKLLPRDIRELEKKGKTVFDTTYKNNQLCHIILIDPSLLQTIEYNSSWEK